NIYRNREGPQASGVTSGAGRQTQVNKDGSCCANQRTGDIRVVLWIGSPKASMPIQLAALHVILWNAAEITGHPARDVVVVAWKIVISVPKGLTIVPFNPGVEAEVDATSRGVKQWQN